MALNPQPGFFITLEGGEGSGKSTQARRLNAFLRRKGRDVVLTREPGGTTHGEAIREMLLSGLIRPFGSEAEALFFAVARREHVLHLIRPALQEGQVVICDRFADSTRAYQGVAGVAPETILRLEETALCDTHPDLTLILDIDPSMGLARAAGRSAADRFEGDELELHEARRQAFLKIAEAEPHRCVVIDAGLSMDEISAQIEAAVVARLPRAGGAS
ncbi:dTMP kinase [Afifella marina]|uniref:Thymidylate kinase n=1 Tax=Afifella marina DSM 2698 TaxID=1120955 RepID=A0A1G5NI32_AFIMA|nr:dTMP kinase [Afifella marina]MBK1623503.1 dTMP kinase [Afifella marina DSM 2698]MBK1626496.1 dTMP kinase [Afifella marina]MBK5916045.1 dTMP kinase [Afifella marina]RAI18350.1 dTMP kinase [Afifella marina DSM 2698]SCZ36834.1 dTMP kinase [Afifella marina DSM 2698]